jgi:hypothetical protein
MNRASLAMKNAFATAFIGAKPTCQAYCSMPTLCRSLVHKFGQGSWRGCCALRTLSAVAEVTKEVLRHKWLSCQASANLYGSPSD